MDESRSAYRILTKEDLDELVNSIKSKKPFADSFVFENDALLSNLFSALNISLNKFKEKYYYYNTESKLHISESEEGFFFISTVGLVPFGRLTSNHLFNAFESQVWVMRTLLTEAERICSSNEVLDIDHPYNELLKTISIAISHNMYFYSELFCKTYLSLSQKTFKKTHRLSELLQEVKNTMNEKGHNNTLFHRLVLPFFQSNMKELSRMPLGFKEENMKYDDNNDNAILLLDREIIRDWRNSINLCNDFFIEYYYDANNCSFFAAV